MIPWRDRPVGPCYFRLNAVTGRVVKEALQTGDVEAEDATSSDDCLLCPADLHQVLEDESFLAALADEGRHAALDLFHRLIADGWSARQVERGAARRTTIRKARIVMGLLPTIQSFAAEEALFRSADNHWAAGTSCTVLDYSPSGCLALIRGERPSVRCGQLVSIVTSDSKRGRRIGVVRWVTRDESGATLRMGILLFAGRAGIMSVRGETRFLTGLVVQRGIVLASKGAGGDEQLELFLPRESVRSINGKMAITFAGTSTHCYIGLIDAGLDYDRAWVNSGGGET